MSNIEIERPTKIYFGGVELPIPVFFPSVSSIKTNLLPVEYVQLLAASGIPQFLVSAYDVVNCPEKEEMANAVNAALGERTVILLDSGNYESFWMNDSSWTKERFHEVLKSHRWPIAFSFDVSCKHEMSSEDCAREIADACSRDRSCGSNCALLPIVHGLAENLPDRCSMVARLLNPLALAVPERELGDGILARVHTVREIRRKLNQLGAYYPLHLLGTGNPRSILLYTAAGADMFDGLEWCQTVADPTSALLFHFQQRDLLENQLITGQYQSYSETTLVHNLLFYASWMSQLRSALASDSMSHCIRERFSPPTAAKIEATVYGH